MAVGVFFDRLFSLNRRGGSLRVHSGRFFVVGRGFLGHYMPFLVVLLQGFETEPDGFFFLLTPSTIANCLNGIVLPK